MKGQGRLNSPLAPSILAGIPVGQRVSGSTPVRQFNIRPSRMKRRCISLLRLAPPCRFVCLATCMAASPPHEKNPRLGANARRARGARERPGYVGGAPARRLPPCGPRPSTSTPARALSRRWPRSTACRRRPSRGACRPAASRRRWRGGAHRAGRIGL